MPRCGHLEQSIARILAVIASDNLLDQVEMPFLLLLLTVFLNRKKHSTDAADVEDDDDADDDGGQKR